MSAECLVCGKGCKCSSTNFSIGPYAAGRFLQFIVHHFHITTSLDDRTMGIIRSQLHQICKLGHANVSRKARLSDHGKPRLRLPYGTLFSLTSYKLIIRKTVNLWKRISVHKDKHDNLMRVRLVMRYRVAHFSLL
uniref:Uncharacterized protein n=1 Tax=Trichuris muris TaxID=70415 RepID=A0A5S6QSD7_TRIMR